jgi:hypothetical protein
MRQAPKCRLAIIDDSATRGESMCFEFPHFFSLCPEDNGMRRRVVACRFVVQGAHSSFLDFGEKLRSVRVAGNDKLDIVPYQPDQMSGGEPVRHRLITKDALSDASHAATLVGLMVRVGSKRRR